MSIYVYIKDITVYTTISAYIAITKDLVDCNSFIYYKSLVIPIIATDLIINRLYIKIAAEINKKFVVKAEV